MIRAGNELMKLVREKLGMTQAQMGEQLHMTQRTVSRIETGVRELGVWEYFSLMEMAGTPTEDLLPLILESNELKDYNTYKELKRLLRDWQLSEIRDILPEFEKGLTSKQLFIVQFVEFVKIFVDKEMPHEEAIEKLYEILRMSIKEFESCAIPKYRLNYNEIHIIFGIAMKLELVSKIDCAISLYKSVVESRDNALATDEDKAVLFPALMHNLSNVLGKLGRYEESLRYCEIARESCISLKNYRLIPNILYNMACCCRLMGEEEQIYQTYFIRAYHSAHAMGNKIIADITKKEAEKFGIFNLCSF